MRCTAESIFDAFPWPQAATVKQIDAVAAAALGATVLALWSSTGSEDSGPRADYSTGRAAYGFSAKKDLLAQLLALNQQVAANIENGSPVTAPGVPPGYPEPERLVTEDCIKPSVIP